VDVADFDFQLPEQLIAQDPPAVRGGSRLMVLRRDTGSIEHSTFSRLGDYLRRGDLLVLNDTKVFPARLLGRRIPGGGAAELLLLERETDDTWQALVHPGQKLKPGARMRFGSGTLGLYGEILAAHFRGRRTVRLWADPHTDTESVIDAIGHVPLPPYIKRDDRPLDRERYQTVYARSRGSVAAPTAGLHFTPELLDMLSALGIERTALTLHVGYGTFKPVTVEQVEDHVVDAERFEVSPEAATALTRARRQRLRIVAVGTTTTRALESLPVSTEGVVDARSGETAVFIRPGHEFRLVDALLTNFHLPRSSLLMLVAAFAGRPRVLDAYREAVAHGYRFYSYGDAMLIL
jgi:S-adenosylmethionine:tRNA ribosyltransferase-isomerase